MFRVPIDIKSVTLTDPEAKQLYETLHKQFGRNSQAETEELKKALMSKRKIVDQLEVRISILQDELEKVREEAFRLRRQANNVRLEYSKRYTDNKKLRRENVELRRKFRQKAEFAEFLMKILNRENAAARLIRGIPNQTVEEKENSSVITAKNVRDRTIMDNFVVANGDDEDLYIMCRVCHNRGFTATRMDGIGMEFVPNGVTGLNMYNAMRGHWDRHHTVGEN